MSNTERKIERDELLKTLYQATSKANLLNQFDNRLDGINAVFKERKTTSTEERRYAYLLEQILFYSHAIIFGHGVQTAHGYRQAFMTTAKTNKKLNLSIERIENAFSFLNRSEKWDFLSDDEKKKTLIKRQAKKPNKRTELQLKRLESRNTTNKDINDYPNTCIAKDEIKRLKEELDTKSYKLAKGQKEEDKQIFIKVALVALSTGSRLKEITETLELSSKKGVTYFTNEEDTKKGIILELDTKTIRAYLKDIKSHYADRIGKVDIGRGIRKAVGRISIPYPHTTKEGVKRDNATSLNHLNYLYDECLTSSTQI